MHTHSHFHSQSNVKIPTKSQRFFYCFFFFSFSIHFILLTARWLLFCKKLYETQGSQSKFHGTKYINLIYIYLLYMYILFSCDNSIVVTVSSFPGFINLEILKVLGLIICSSHVVYFDAFMFLFLFICLFVCLVFLSSVFLSSTFASVRHVFLLRRKEKKTTCTNNTRDLYKVKNVITWVFKKSHNEKDILKNKTWNEIRKVFFWKRVHMCNVTGNKNKI